MWPVGVAICAAMGCGRVNDDGASSAGVGGAAGGAGSGSAGRPTVTGGASGAGTGSSGASGGGNGGAVDGGAAGAAGLAGGTGGTCGSGAGGSSTGAGGSMAMPCAPNAPLAPARVWQLSDQEYVTVVRQIFGVSLSDAEAPKAERSAQPGEYANFSEARTVDFNAANAYARAAEIVATRVAADLPCAPPDDACVEAYLRRTVPRAYRRAITDADVANLMSLYRGAAATDGAAVGAGLALQAVLMSPFFLYRTEVGTNAAGASSPVSLTPHELASALSFMFLDSAPDDALWCAAESGALASPSELAAQVDRLLALPGARQNLARTVSYWLGLEAPSTPKNHFVFPVYTPELAVDLDKSVKAFLDDVLWNGHLTDLFTSSTVFVNAQLSSVYSIMGGLDTTLVPIQTHVPERSAGLLTQPGMLMATNRGAALGDVVHRGLFVYRALLCGSDAGNLPPPPADEAAVAATMTGTEREKAGKRAAMTCGACHSLVDPLGLLFERYDAIGRYSATAELVPDAQAPGGYAWSTSPTPIDTSAVLSPSLGADLAGPVADVARLASKLVASKKRVAYCAARYVGQYSVGHDTKDSCTTKAAGDVFLQSESFADLSIHRDISGLHHPRSGEAMKNRRTKNQRSRLTRRAALGGLGSAAGAAVLLRPLVAEAEGLLPQRFLYIHYPCGTVSDSQAKARTPIGIGFLTARRARTTRRRRSSICSPA